MCGVSRCYFIMLRGEETQILAISAVVWNENFSFYLTFISKNARWHKTFPTDRTVNGTNSVHNFGWNMYI
jgi:hypothetical protein